MSEQKRWIPISAPALVGREKEYVADCVESSWISSCGKYVEQFERDFAEFCGARHAVSCCNGTAALHLALLALGVGPGDEVIVPTLTFVATANAVTYCGAKPIFVDVDPHLWTLDPDAVERAVTARTRAVVAVHLYGHPADMDALDDIARQRNLYVVEDAAQAHGAEYRGRRVGSLGALASFSFYGNKIISTGEGGMVTADDDALAARTALFRGQGMDPERRYWFPVVGHNYRMMNLAAAVGVAQLERIEWHLARRFEVADWYRERLRDLPQLHWQATAKNARGVPWLFTVTLDDDVPLERDDVMSRLLRRGVETRPIFYPMHVLPPYRGEAPVARFPVADRLSARGLSLPTHANLTEEDVAYVCDALRECLDR